MRFACRLCRCKVRFRDRLATEWTTALDRGRLLSVVELEVRRTPGASKLVVCHCDSLTIYMLGIDLGGLLSSISGLFKYRLQPYHGERYFTRPRTCGPDSR